MVSYTAANNHVLRVLTKPRRGQRVDAFNLSPPSWGLYREIRTQSFRAAALRSSGGEEPWESTGAETHGTHADPWPPQFHPRASNTLPLHSLVPSSLSECATLSDPELQSGVAVGSKRATKSLHSSGYSSQRRQTLVFKIYSFIDTRQALPSPCVYISEMS